MDFIITIDYKDTMTTKPVVLILGAGARIGASVAKSFSSNGYNVAIASRSGGKGAEGAYLSLIADFTVPDSVPGLFNTVKAEFKTAPSVVVYNAAALTNPPEKDAIFSVSSTSVISDLNVNVVSAYVAAQEAVKGFEILPQGTKKTFIYTGNILNLSIIPVPLMMDLGMGKSASAYWIGLADVLYSAKGIR